MPNSGGSARTFSLRVPPSAEEVQGIFERRGPGSPIPLSSELLLGSTRVRVRTTRDILSGWLTPALGLIPASSIPIESHDFQLSIAMRSDLMGVDDLTFWIGQGSRHGFYESIHINGDVFLFEHSSKFLAYWSPEKRKAFVCLDDLRNLAAWEIAAPIKAVIHGICTGMPLQLLHAGG